MEKILSEYDEKKRGSLIKNVIKVGDALLELKNFNGLFALLSALESSSISRLRHSWDQVPSKYKQVLEKLKKATDHSRNYAEYREMIRNTASCLPFLGLFLKDLVFIHDGNHDTKREGELINFSKYMKMSALVQEIRRFQAGSYDIDEVEEMQRWMYSQFLTNSNQQSLDFYRQSLIIEPRQWNYSATTSSQVIHRLYYLW